MVAPFSLRSENPSPRARIAGNLLTYTEIIKHFSLTGKEKVKTQSSHDLKVSLLV